MSAGDAPTFRDRARLFAAEHRSLVLGLCVLLVLGGGLVAYQTHTGPDTRPDERVVGSLTSNASFDHGAVVRRQSAAYDRGTVLRNRSVYFRRITPILNGSYELSHTGSEDGVTVRTNLTLVVRAVDSGGDGDRVLWSLSEDLGTVESSDLGAGRSHRSPFEFNVSERLVTAARVREDLGSTLGEPQLLLLVESEIRATVEGEAVSQRRQDRLLIRPQRGVYRVVPDPAPSSSEPVTETVAVPVETDPLRAYGSIVAVVLGLLLGTTLLVLERTDRLDVPAGTEREIRRRKERDSFTEWISRGRAPPADEDERVVAVDSLEDLVDVAIDSDRRVIEDRDRNEFVVFDGSTRYRFRHTDGTGVGPGSPSLAATGESDPEARPSTDDPEVKGDEKEGTRSDEQHPDG
jgi:hypothetical protein